jgi:SpoVK/Ycf46/Vps4 family AAA+-type ATPase
MATSQQLKALLRSHIDGDDAQFYAVAMQLAAHEAKQGHGQLAIEIRELIDRAKQSSYKKELAIVPLVKPRGELSDLLVASYPKQRLSDIILPAEIIKRLQRLISEHAQVHKLRSHGLSPRKKILLVGPPGTGKTLTASVLAGELGLPLFVVRLDGLMTKFMGETASKLRLIFDAINQVRGVYLFDEFDSIGSHRGMTNDVGEIRRVLNSFLLMLEGDQSDSILVAATNYVDLLDHALFRRFDDVIKYHLPTEDEIIITLKNKLTNFSKGRIDWKVLAEVASKLSFSEITQACDDAIKHILIHDKSKISQIDLLTALEDRVISTHYTGLR